MAERVRLDGITKRFGEMVAVNHVSLTVEPGETVGLVGPSGCGKTTTLRTVAGFETPTEGRVLFDEEDVTNVPPEQRNVGLVFQSYALFDNMTVQENVEFGLKMRSIPAEEREARATEMLSMLDIADLADRDPTTLSGGQQQRVGLARALAIEPRVLLLDEPMTGLDAQLKSRLQREIGGLLDDLDVTALYVTHDQEEAMVMCDRIAVMNDGVIEQVGSPTEVYERPSNPFVADFVGTSNLLEAQAREGELDLGFAAVEADGIEADGEVTAVARPDAFSVGEGTVEAAITDRFYLGDRVQINAELPDGQDVVLRVSPERATELDGTVGVDLDPESVHVVE